MRDRLRDIYDKTDGYCHLCYKKLSWLNYGKYGFKGAWQIEHSKPKSKGGTNHFNNLYPACISCNQEKGVLSTRVIRQRNGLSRAPYSRVKKDKIKKSNTQTVAAAGMIVGAVVGGPILAGILTVIGAEVGRHISPEK